MIIYISVGSGVVFVIVAAILVSCYASYFGSKLVTDKTNKNADVVMEDIYSDESSQVFNPLETTVLDLSSATADESTASNSPLDSNMSSPKSPVLSLIRPSLLASPRLPSFLLSPRSADNEDLKAFKTEENELDARPSVTSRYSVYSGPETGKVAFMMNPMLKMKSQMGSSVSSPVSKDDLNEDEEIRGIFCY